MQDNTQKELIEGLEKRNEIKDQYIEALENQVESLAEGIEIHQKYIKALERCAEAGKQYIEALKSQIEYLELKKGFQHG